MIIWDEYKHGKYVYTSQVNTKKWQLKELKCVVKYMVENGFKPSDIRNKLAECCEESLRYLNDGLRTKLFNKIIQQARREKIIKNKKIIIYKSEIDAIKSLGDINLEKTIFVLLVYSKWLDNIEWFALMRADIYKEAKLSKLNSVNKQKVLTTLCNSGLLRSDVKRIRKGRSDDKKQMWNIPFLQDSGEIAFEFDNYINVVYRYLNYVYGGYFECQDCGGMFTKNSNRQSLCSKCSDIRRKKYKAQKEKERRKRLRGQLEIAQNADK